MCDIFLWIQVFLGLFGIRKILILIECHHGPLRHVFEGQIIQSCVKNPKILGSLGLGIQTLLFNEIDGVYPLPS